MTHDRGPKDVSIPARDGCPLAGTLYPSDTSARRVVVINAAVAVPGKFYRHFAAGLAEAGYTAVTLSGTYNGQPGLSGNGQGLGLFGHGGGG